MKVIVKANGDVVIRRGKSKASAAPHIRADELRSKIPLLKSQRLRQALAALANAIEGTPAIGLSDNIIDLDDAWYAEEQK